MGRGGRGEVRGEGRGEKRGGRRGEKRGERGEVKMSILFDTQTLPQL